VPFVFTVCRLNPPLNHPQVTSAAFNKSRMFLPLIRTCNVVAEEHTSFNGSGSPIAVCPPLRSLMTEPPEIPFVVATAFVWPEMRLRAPGVEGPKTVPKELSFNA